MYSFYQLTVNECLKIMKKRSFFLPFLIMMLIPLGIALVVKKFSPGTEIGLFDFLQSSMSVQGGGKVLTFLCIIYMAGLVSSEHQLGTIKLLLIRAHSRNKILASKYMTLILFLLALMLFTLIIGTIINVLFFGFNSSEMGLSDLLKYSGYTFIYALIYASIAFMFSILTKSTGATIGISFLLVFIEDIVIMLLSRYSFAKYILYFNTDLGIYEDGEPMIEGMSLGFSSVILLLYMIVIVGLSFYVFKKRDVS